MHPRPVVPGAGQESVWAYPRPPRLEPTSKRLIVVVGNLVVADTVAGHRVLETSHPPVYYLPLADVRADLLRRSAGGSACEWKGRATYWDIEIDGQRRHQVAWSYDAPAERFLPIASALAFYAGRVDQCSVDGEIATPQPGAFYGGWVTRDIVGPFKGEPGTMGW